MATTAAKKDWRPTVKAGSVVRVWQKVKEGEKFRLQAFEGLVIARKHGAEPGATFTVRKVSEGIGVERIFPLHAPFIEKVDLVKGAKVRRAKLYYVREKAAREVKRKMRHERVLTPATVETVVEGE